MADYVFPEREWGTVAPMLPPVPIVTSRPAIDDEIPARVITLRVLAQAHGWRTRVTYSRGTRQGRPPRVVDSIALRMQRDEVLMWAVWLDGLFDTAMIWRRNDAPYVAKLANVREEIQA